MRKRTATLIALAAIAPPAVTGIALATPPSGLTSELLARGGARELEIRDRSLDLRLEAEEPTDAAVVRATLEPRGSTGWHGHPGPSLVVVKSGTLTMIQPARGGTCSIRAFGPGSAFEHPKRVHTFENRTEAPVEFYVVYLVPAGAAPLLNDVPTVPEQCA